MRSDEPLAHAEAVRGMASAARRGRLSHALLLQGPDGIGKFLAAERLAFALLCPRSVAADEPPCLACGPCKRLAKDAHPDVFVIDALAEGQEVIRVQRIQPRAGGEGGSLGEFLSLRPMEGARRVALVRDADRMNEEAQNALLKTLEEPGRDVHIVLTTARPERLLATVHSRCVRVQLDRPPPAATRAWLEARGLDAAAAADLAAWSRGAPGRALELEASGARAIVPALRALLAGEIGATAAGERIEAALAAAPREDRRAARERARFVLDLAIDALRDALRPAAGLAPAGPLVGPEGAPRLSPAALAARLEAALLGRQDVDLNLAPDAVLERTLRALEPAGARAPLR